MNVRSSACKDIWEFIQNSGHIINKRALESLIKSGAFDSVHKNRKQLYESMDMLIYFANKNKQDRESSQAALFGSLDVLKPKLENVEDFDEEEKLEHELFSLGFYLTNHPLEKFKTLLEKLNIGFIGENRTAKTAGVILNARLRISKTLQSCLIVKLAREVINLHKAPSSRAIVSYILLRKMFCFIYNQSLSTGFSSGEYGGRYIMVPILLYTN